jgi:hypothetical protein
MPDEQPRSKSIKVSGDRKTGVIIKRIKQIDGYQNSIPQTLGEPHPFEPDLFFFDADFQPLEGGWGDLMINYSWIQNGLFETELRAQVQDVPLERHPGYVLNWNYNLFGDLDFIADSSVPEWWSAGNLKTIDEFKNADTDGNYKIVTNMNASNGALIAGRIKPNNTYKKPTYAVLETIYWQTLSDAKDETANLGKIATPADDFGLTDGDFLLTSAPITRSGGYYMVRKTYEYNDGLDPWSDTKGWDGELYL